MKWPSDFPHMTGPAGPTFMGANGIKGFYAHKDGEWFRIGKRKEGDVDTDYVLADRGVELVTDPDVLAKLGPARSLVPAV
jgi:hypothetical protein